MARKSRKSPVQTPAISSAELTILDDVRSRVWPDAWARSLSLKVDGHYFDLKGREYERQIIRDESDWIVMPKGAQLGLTTTFIVRTCHWMTQRSWHHGYLLPLKSGSMPFVQGRIDPVIDSNPDLKRLFASVENRMHKQTVEKINWYIRGTNIWTELREIPVDVMIFDERDKMIEENIPEAMARLDGSKVRRVVELSTPTQPGHGVDAEDAWPASDQHRWHVPCPHCNRYQVFSFLENVEVGEKAEDCFLFCQFCRKVITDDQRAEANGRGHWTADNLTAVKRGYHISQLNSPTKTIEGFMTNFFEGQRDSRKLRAFYNNNQGLPYVALGDQFTPELLDKAIGSGHTLGGIPNGPVYIGIDVGEVLHVKASYFDRYSRRVSWQFKIFRNGDGKTMWQRLDDWLSTLATFQCVIDAHPEKSAARELSLKYHRRVWLGLERDQPNQVETAVFNNPGPGDVGKVTIDRTMAFDSVIKSYLDGNTILPVDARELGEHMPRLPYNGFYHQMVQQVRDEDYDTNERIVARWKKNKNPDHWHHADMFEYVATMHQPYVSIPREVGELFNRAGGLVAA